MSNQIAQFYTLLQTIQSIKANQKNFVIANWASMKTGKSTYLNAILKKSLLSSSNQAETSGITIIRNDPTCTVPKLFAVANGNSAFTGNAIAGQLLAEGDKNIRDKIREINANLRANHASNEHAIILLVAKVECMQSCTNIELWDTPGPNEAANKLVADLAKQALLHCNYIQMLFDYTSCCCSTDEEAMCKLVATTRPDLLKPEAMHIIINKVDMKGPDGKSFDEMQSTVKANLRKFTGISVENATVMFISARKALDATLILGNCIQQNSQDADALISAYAQHDVETFEELLKLPWQKTLEKSNIAAAHQFITTATSNPSFKTAALKCTISTLLPIVEASITQAYNSKEQQFKNELAALSQQFEQKQHEYSKVLAQYNAVLALPITVTVPFNNTGTTRKEFNNQSGANQFATSSASSCCYTLQCALDNQISAKVLDMNNKLMAYSQELAQYNKVCGSGIASIPNISKPACNISQSVSIGSYVSDASYDQPYQATRVVTVARQVPRQVTKKQRIFGIVVDKETYTVYDTQHVPETQYYTAYNRIQCFHVNEHGIMQEVFNQYMNQESNIVATLKTQYHNAVGAVMQQVNKHNDTVKQQFQQQKQAVEANLANAKQASAAEIEKLKQQNK